MEDLGPRKTKDIEYAAHLRHSLMNPLTVIIGYANMLLSRQDISPDAIAQIRQILHEANECVRIIEHSRNWDATRKRVMVVDDEEVIHRLTADILGSNYEIVGIKQGEEALNLLLTEHFDAILIDINLAGKMSGRELFEQLKTRHPEVEKRVLFLSGAFLSDDDNDFIKNAGRRIIFKPFSIKVLREVVQEIAG